jgi:hypothetical protein
MPRDGATIFSDLIGKLDVLRVECPKFGRAGRYRLADLIMRYGRNAQAVAAAVLARRGGVQAAGRSMKTIAVALLAFIVGTIAILTSTCNFVDAQDRGTFQSWDAEYTAREWLIDCGQKNDKCYFFTRTIAQASFWFDKCIPNGTSIAKIADVTMTFIKQNPQYVDAPASNVLLTAMHMYWKCRD